MTLRRARRDPRDERRLLHCLAVRNEPQHLQLAAREPVRIARRWFRERGTHRSGIEGAHVDRALAHVTDCLEQVLDALRVTDEPPDAQAESLGNDARLLV